MPTRRRSRVSPEAVRCAQLHERVREALALTLGPSVTAVDLAGALMYEVASITATLCTTEADAQRAIQGLADVACQQIAEMGVGAPHP